MLSKACNLGRIRPTSALCGTYRPNRMFFEGTEKKLEVVTSAPSPSLRALGPGRWGEIVGRAGAAVLSTVSGDRGDAYLLSESSLFVFDHRALIITCGQTNLPLALLELLEDVPEESIEMLFYERKNEVFPHGQSTSFFDDAARIGSRLPGTARCFGDADEHHLYLWSLERDGAPPDGSSILADGDTTLEILMYGLGEDIRRVFHTDPASRRDAIRDRLRPDRMLAGFRTIDWLFDPVGYSLNALRGDEYFTMHVTPQAIGSYASFETGRAFASQAELDDCVRRVVEVFEPRSFDVVLFTRGVDREVRCEGLIERRRDSSPASAEWFGPVWIRLDPFVGRLLVVC